MKTSFLPKYQRNFLRIWKVIIGTRFCSMVLLDLQGYYNFGVILLAWVSKVLLKSTKIAKVLNIWYRWNEVSSDLFLSNWQFKDFQKYNFADPLKPGSLEYHVGGLHYSPKKSTFLCASRWNKVQKPLLLQSLAGNADAWRAIWLHLHCDSLGRSYWRTDRRKKNGDMDDGVSP